jgi:phosphoglycolate phosphatase
MPMMPSADARLAAVLFDLDGTLVDSEPDLRAALNDMLAAEGRRPLIRDEVKPMIGDGAAMLVDRAFRATGAALAVAGQAAATARFLALYEPRAARLTRPYPGVTAALTELAGAGLRLGLCTNKPERATRLLLAELGLARFFAAIVGGDTLPGLRKPDPRLAFALLDRLAVPPASAVYVGDHENDLATARAAGLPVILFSGGYARAPVATLGADAVIDDFSRLPQALGAVFLTRPRAGP